MTIELYFICIGLFISKFWKWKIYEHWLPVKKEKKHLANRIDKLYESLSSSMNLINDEGERYTVKKFTLHWDKQISVKWSRWVLIIRSEYRSIDIAMYPLWTKQAHYPPNEWDQRMLYQNRLEKWENYQKNTQWRFSFEQIDWMITKIENAIKKHKSTTKSDLLRLFK